MPNTVRLVVLALWLAAPTGAGASEAEWLRALQAGRAAYLRFDYAGAERLFREALRAGGDRQGFEALAELGDVLFVRGRDAEAAQVYERALRQEERRFGEASPRANRTRWALFAVFTAREDFRGAAVFFRRVVPEPVPPALDSVVLAPPTDLARARVLSGFPVKYSEAIHRRTLRLQEAIHGATASAAPARSLVALFQEQKRQDALRAITEHFSVGVSTGVNAESPASRD
jgi:tetratricopeptide (TPR) repeat protein